VGGVQTVSEATDPWALDDAAPIGTLDMGTVRRFHIKIVMARYFSLGGFLCLIGGCSSGLTSTPSDSRAALAPAAASSSGTLQQAKELLSRSGHSCDLKSDVVTCDAEDRTRPTLAISATPSGQDPYLFLVESFSLGATESCAMLAGKLNEVQLSHDVIRVTCTRDHLIFSVPIFVPAAGLADEDVKRFVAGWQQTVHETMSAAGLWAYLK
jgi:hypothetical protein